MYANFILNFTFKVETEVTAYMVSFSNKQIRIIYLQFSELQLVPTKLTWSCCQLFLYIYNLFIIKNI